MKLIPYFQGSSKGNPDAIDNRKGIKAIKQMSNSGEEVIQVKKKRVAGDPVLHIRSTNLCHMIHRQALPHVFFSSG